MTNSPAIRNARHTWDWPSKRSVEKTTTTAETAMTTTSFRPTSPSPPRQYESSTSRGRRVQAVSGVLVTVGRSLSWADTVDDRRKDLYVRPTAPIPRPFSEHPTDNSSVDYCSFDSQHAIDRVFKFTAPSGTQLDVTARDWRGLCYF